MALLTLPQSPLASLCIQSSHCSFSFIATFLKYNLATKYQHLYLQYLQLHLYLQYLSRNAQYIQSYMTGDFKQKKQLFQAVCSLLIRCKLFHFNTSITYLKGKSYLIHLSRSDILPIVQSLFPRHLSSRTRVIQTIQLSND